ncbi:hypothetical protein [Kingella denitrificans]|uniref:hypothetical protein n=1 Tax=Kingella denitrificans TaxID=502 RepID=UPI0028D1A82D|nr:hypothetical protein [Kingella denitrificans]
MLKRILLLSFALAYSAFSFALEPIPAGRFRTADEEYAWQERNVPRDPNRALPCNYVNVPAQLWCYERENRFMRVFFRSVPAKLQSRGRDGVRFRREQAAFERRVARSCNDPHCDYQGEGCGMVYERCVYHKYLPRYLKLKRSLGKSPSAR